MYIIMISNYSDLVIEIGILMGSIINISHPDLDGREHTVLAQASAGCDVTTIEEQTEWPVDDAANVTLGQKGSGHG